MATLYILKTENIVVAVVVAVVVVVVAVVVVVVVVVAVLMEIRFKNVSSGQDENNGNDAGT